MIARQKPEALLGRPNKTGGKDRRHRKIKTPHSPHPEELHT